MWLYIPKSTSASTQAVAVSISASDLRTQMLARSYTWNESFKPPRSWSTILKRDSWSLHLYGLIPEPSIANRLLTEWIGSSGASPASHSVSPAENSEPMTPAGSGLTSRDWLARYDPEDCSWKTSQASFMEELNTFSEGWPRSGTMRNGFVYERPTLVRPIAGSECSLWPTARAAESASHETGVTWNGKYYVRQVGSKVNTALTHASNKELGKEGREKQVRLLDQAETWLTPLANEDAVGTIDGNMQNMLSHQVQEQAQNWATPAARDYRSDVMEHDFKNHGSPPLSRQAPRAPMPGQESSPTDPTLHRPLHGTQNLTTSEPSSVSSRRQNLVPTEKDDGTLMMHVSALNIGGLLPGSQRRLNPKFVEWLMALPEGWTDFHALLDSESSGTG